MKNRLASPGLRQNPSKVNEQPGDLNSDGSYVVMKQPDLVKYKTTAGPSNENTVSPQ